MINVDLSIFFYYIKIKLKTLGGGKIVQDLSKEKKKAKKMYLQGCTYKEIAAAVGRNVRTVQAWKQKENWQRSNSTNKENRYNNALGNKGNKNATAPPNNTNAVKTGENETILIDSLTQEEKLLFYEQENKSALEQLNNDIALLKVRQRRMLHRVNEALKELDPDEIKQYYRVKNGKRTLVQEEITKTQQLEKVLAIEEAMTRVSKTLSNALKQKTDLENQQLKIDVLTLQKEKLEQEVKRMKLLNGDTDVRQDDGFIAALSDLASNESVWSDVDD